MFSSGILLAGGLVHSLPDAAKKFEDLQRAHNDRVFPWANVIFGSTFMLFLMTEAFMERAIDNYLGDKAGIACHEEKANITANTVAKTNSMPAIDECTDCNIHADDTIGCTLHRKPAQYLVSNKRPSVVGIVHVEAELENLDERQTINPWVAVLLLVVMSIHVILEGIAVGSASSVSNITSLFISIIFHRGFSAFALGSSFITSGYWDKNRPGGRKMFYIMTAVFVAMDIFGLGLGWGIGASFGEDSYGEAVIDSMLGGSFLFVSAAELIPGQLEKIRVYKFPVVLPMLSMAVGFAAMSALGAAEMEN